MFGKILGFFTSGSTSMYIGIAVLAIIGSLSFGLYYFHNSYVKQVSVSEVLRSENEGLLIKLKSSSDEVKQLGIDSRAREAKAAIELAKARELTKYYMKKSQDRLLSAPAIPDDLCASADLMFNDYIQEK